MSSIIDNREKMMVDSLRKALNHADKIDILTAFFYFSGFNALANELKNKKIRILVGNTIDPLAIDDLCRAVKDDYDELLEPYAVRGYNRLNSLQKKDAYIRSFIDIFNKSALSEQFDSTDSQNIFKMFLRKIKDGSLEIRLTAIQNHAKAYIITNKYEYSSFGEQKGVVFSGSSNFTFNGLLGQGEMNECFSSNKKFDEYMSKFDELWNDSRAIDICIKDGNDDFEKKMKEKLWIFSQPDPYKIYMRILYELFNSSECNEINTPSDITEGRYFNLKYQIDAIRMGVDCINKNSGVIIADVVGLGKSIIASAIAYNLDIRKTVIIAPPHLVDQWNDYQQEFGIRGVKVYSSGKIEDVYNCYADDPEPILYIIDEAHRYRNELSNDYQMLHQITRSNSDNKVILLTATPYNNRPQDLFALIKLFQTPSRSTINTVDNLGVRFHELIARYNKLEKEGKRDLDDSVKRELNKLSDELRIMIDPIIIRRSRIDLMQIKEYYDDLKRQNIEFPEIVGPTLLEYDLGEIRTLYINTLDKLSNKFKCARYNPSYYLKDIDAFNKKYGDLFGEMNIQLFQGNLAQFIKRLLVMRFESSKASFKTTLTSLLKSCESIKKWWDKGYVPIKKSGYLSDPDDEEIQTTLDEINRDDELLDLNKIKKKAIPFERELFKDEYIAAVENDVQLLSSIYHEWFDNGELGDDPKYNEVVKKLTILLDENPKRKIVVFSGFADTANYVSTRLINDGFRVFLYTGSSVRNDRITVKRNFDASLKTNEQEDKYDIIVATDALSEGFNLNRAGVIINYDIPYNPTRVVQRIGRINRINKKMYDYISIYNLFPTDIGEQNTLIKGISTLKMLLINNIIGSDTRTLTPDETLESYFQRQYKEASDKDDEMSWDVEYRNHYDLIKYDKIFIGELLKIPERVRIVRKNQKMKCAISFAKRGNSSLFAIASKDEEAQIVPAEKILKLFNAEESERGFECDPELDKKFAVLKNELKRTYPKIKIDKRRGIALENIKQLIVACPSEKDYLNDLYEVIQNYDDLSDGELKFIANIKIVLNKSKDIVLGIKEKLPIHYIIQIKTKVEGIDSQTETIMFTEDLRNDNY